MYFRIFAMMDDNATEIRIKRASHRNSAIFFLKAIINKIIGTPKAIGPAELVIKINIGSNAEILFS